jgi:hypothetical protein
MHKCANIVLAIALALPILFSLISLPLTDTAAFATSRPHTIQKNNGVGAVAQWNTPEGLTTVGIVQDQFGKDIILTRETPNGFEFGESGNILANVFQTSNNLATATLFPVTINAYIFDEFGNTISCEDLTIQVTWTAVGSPVTVPNQNTFTSKGLILHFTGINTHDPQ